MTTLSLLCGTITGVTDMLCYTELSKLETFEERFEYLRMNGLVGDTTFGGSRYLNQAFYKSPEWRSVRDRVIIRDKGCDLGIEGHEIHSRPLVHHINPVTKDDLISRSKWIFDPENLITVSHTTHNAIHYGDTSLILSTSARRTPNDTCPWK